jgi:hypothetical protein
MAPKRRPSTSNDEEEEEDEYWNYNPIPSKSRATRTLVSPAKKRKVQAEPRYTQADRPLKPIDEDKDSSPVRQPSRRRPAHMHQESEEEEEEAEPVTEKPIRASTRQRQRPTRTQKESAEEEDKPEDPVRQPSRRRQPLTRTQEASEEEDSHQESESAQDPSPGNFQDDSDSLPDDPLLNKRKSGGLVAAQKRTMGHKVLSAASQAGKGSKNLGNDLAASILEEFAVPLDPRRKNCNRLVKWIKDGSIKPPIKGAKHDYKPVGPARYVWDLPKREGRDFVLLEDKIRLYSMDLDSSKVKVWRLEVRDMSSPWSKPVQIFRYVKRKSVFHNNPLTEKLCSNLSEVVRLGKIYTDIMNRMPVDFSASEWDTRSFWAEAKGANDFKVRRFIEPLALLRWKPDLDFSTLHKDFVDFNKSLAHGYGMPLNIMDTRKGSTSKAKVIQTTSPAQWVYLIGAGKSQQAKFSVTLDDIDISTTGSEIDTPSGYAYKNNYLSPGGPQQIGGFDTSDAKLKAAVRIVQSVHYRMNGMVGDLSQLSSAISSMVNTHLTQAKDGQRGSYNGGLLTSSPRAYGNNINIFLSVFVGKLLGYSGKSGPPRVAVHSRNRIVLAYVMHQGYVALRSGKSLLHSVQAMFTAGDEVEIGIVNVKIIKETYCLCLPDQRHTTEHVCMHCFQVLTCSVMGCDNDGRILCVDCSRRNDLADELKGPSLQEYVGRAVRGALSNDKKSGSNPPKWTAKSMTESLVRSHQIDDKHWRDGFNGEVALEIAQYTDVIQMGKSGRIITKPHRPSFEKPFPFWLDEDGKLYLHHPDNGTITLYCTNVGHTMGIPAMLPLDRVAVGLTDLTQNLKPVVGYDTSVAAQYEAYDRATDSIYAVSMSAPLSARARTAASRTYANRKGFDIIKRQMTTGIFEGTLPSRMYTSRAEMRSYFQRLSTNEYKPWSAAKIKQLMNQLKLLEASPRFNPYGLKFSRNTDGSPWFWRLSHRPSNADWNFLNREFQARFWTMDEWCDESNETPESACTIFLFYAIFWLRTGGKCHFFGCEMTYAYGHPECFSLGRAVVILDNNGVYIRDVIPGEAMRTGFSSLNPTDIEKQFDFSKCTIIVETWWANSLRHNFRGGQGMIETLKETVRKRSMETEFYGRPQDAEKYPKFPMPGPYKQQMNRTWRATLEPDISDDNDLSTEDLYEFESDDEEDALAPFDDFDADEEQPSGSEKDSNQRVEDTGSHDEEGATTLVENPTAADDLVPELEGNSNPTHSVVDTQITLTFQ